MSQTLFFYGTLCHVPLLECVLGRPADQIAMRPATLADHLVSWVQNEPFPMIAAAPGQVAHGVLVSDLSPTDVARLRFYEGAFEYDLTPVQVEHAGGSTVAEVFYPEPGLWTPGPPWSFAQWRQRWGAVNLRTAGEVMAEFGKRSAAEIARILPFLRARSWSQHLAQAGAPATLRRATTPEQVDVHLQDGDDGFFQLQSFDVAHQRFDGAQSETVRRSAFIAYDAALVLPYDPLRDLVMLVEQIRYGPLLRGDPRPWTLEPIAGLVDAGEQPVETARREAQEEAGLHLKDIRPMLQVYAAPGYSTEYYHCFVALTDLDPAHAGLGGLDSEEEDIRSHVMSFEQAMQLLDSGEITGGPGAMMLLWLARQRDALRAQAV